MFCICSFTDALVRSRHYSTHLLPRMPTYVHWRRGVKRQHLAGSDHFRKLVPINANNPLMGHAPVRVAEYDSAGGVQ